METMVMLKPFLIEETAKTPLINFNPNGRFNIKGVSTPLDAAGFYFEVLDWLTDYYREPAENTSLLVEFEHINSSSSSMLFRMFHLLNRLQESNKSTVRCIWAYDVEDDFMKEFIDSIQDMATSLKIITEPKSFEFED